MLFRTGGVEVIDAVVVVTSGEVELTVVESGVFELEVTTPRLPATIFTVYAHIGSYTRQ